MEGNSLLKICFTLAFYSTLSLTATAENSKLSPEEMELAKTLKPISEETKDFLQYLKVLDKEYENNPKVSTKKVMDMHGEKLALLYCKAIGINEPCTPKKSVDPSKSTFEPLKQSVKNINNRWWNWIRGHEYNVGVIPDSSACESVPYQLGERVGIYMDDEDRRNANSQDGWIGNTQSGRNTKWNFCRLTRNQSLQFHNLTGGGNQYNYSVISFGYRCPPGGHRVVRYQENEIHRNANSSNGDIFPNFRQRKYGFKKLWVTQYCEFDGGTGYPYMSQFPYLNFSYGVFARNLPYAIESGSVYQDDEDWWNQNRWNGTPHSTMNGGRNTKRYLAKVRY